MGSMDADEKLVLDQIKEAGDLGSSCSSSLNLTLGCATDGERRCAGIWSRTLTTKTGLPSGTVTKALKALESRKQVKTVKSVKVRSLPFSGRAQGPVARPAPPASQDSATD